MGNVAAKMSLTFRTRRRAVISVGVTISGMTGRGSIRHNNRSFSAANIDRSRTGLNVTFCQEDLKQVYHQVFDEALAAYNAKKKKTRDKIPDYYEHIRQGKQEKLFHEVIFQIGNKDDCGCGTLDGDRAAAVLKEFAESFQERNPHLRVFNAVLHMDEATPHIHIDFVPVATEQTRGLQTRVSMKQALKQQGFTSLGRNMTEWRAWMEREKQTLAELAQAHEFEIVSLGGGRKHMDLPEYRAAAQRLEAVQEQVIAADQELADLEKQKKALGGTVRALKAAEKVQVRLDTIQPEKTLTGAVKGVTVEQVEQLKAAALRGVQAEQMVKELTKKNNELQSRIPSVSKQLDEAKAQQKIRQENQRLQMDMVYLQEQLEEERNFSARLLAGIDAALDYLWEHLPEPLRPIIEKAQQLIPVPDVQKPVQKQERGHSWGDMSL
ncbi:plasmid recombination protein [uncultured Alistipes sp.]|uniref:plasmid recombination protein n=1 Tax=uncultured Alistipes sp. TaxID=538949 RepID=UPI00321F6F71